MTAARTVGIVARPDLAAAEPTLRELVSWLGGRGVQACLEARTAALLEDGGAPCRVADGRAVAEQADALVVLGGDGTLLRASHLVEKETTPIVGVNFGSLGFLTEIALPELFPVLERVLDGSYAYEQRRMLRAVVRRSGAQPEEAGDALNDVVVMKAGAVSRIIELEVAVDGVFVSTFRADGLIVASTTGSTAYNLAAGGPILYPTLPAMVLNPISPHMLSNRPLVVTDEATVEIRLDSRDGDVHATLDGHRAFPLSPGDTVAVTRSPHTLRLVKAPARDYFELLRTKLKWGESTRDRRS